MDLLHLKKICPTLPRLGTPEAHSSCIVVTEELSRVCRPAPAAEDGKLRRFANRITLCEALANLSATFSIHASSWSIGVFSGISTPGWTRSNLYRQARERSILLENFTSVATLFDMLKTQLRCQPDRQGKPPHILLSVKLLWLVIISNNKLRLLPTTTRYIR